MNGDFIILVGAPLARAIAGWAQNALTDDKISQLEWKKLVETIFRLGVPAFALYFGMNLSVEISAALPILADYVFNYAVKFIKKQKEKK